MEFKSFDECLNTKDQIVNDITSIYEARIVYDDLIKIYLIMQTIKVRNIKSKLEA